LRIVGGYVFYPSTASFYVSLMPIPVPPNKDKGVRSTRDLLHHAIQNLLLHNDAIWPPKCGATYQWCMQHVFGDHIGRTVEAYVDDIVVKTRKADDLVNDLRTVFDCLRANGVKLNPENASSGCRAACCWDTLFPSRASSPTPKRSHRSTRWA
jgi:hypothetical protein